MIWAPLALVAATGAMVALPLTPALLEVRSRQDAAPLPTRTDDGNIRNFANAFRSYIEPVKTMLATCVERGSVHQAKLRDGVDAILIGAPTECAFATNEVNAVVLCGGDEVHLPSDTIFSRDLYCSGILFGGDNDVYRAILAESDVFLGSNTTVLRWMHAEGAIRVGSGSAIFGRTSSEKAIQFGSGCRFERVHARTVAFGGSDLAPQQARANIYGKRSIMDVRLGRLRVRGDFHLSAGELLEGHIIASGGVRIEDCARIAGSAKSRKDIHIGENTELHGTVVSGGDLHIARGCFLRGPVIAEGEIYIGAGTQIGSPESLTTVSAPRIRIAHGVVVHGTVWARTSGTVEA